MPVGVYCDGSYEDNVLYALLGNVVEDMTSQYCVLLYLNDKKPKVIISTVQVTVMTKANVNFTTM